MNNRVHKVITLADGCEFEGVFDGEMRNGLGMKRYPNGARFFGIYVDDVRHGNGYKMHADGSVHWVSYINGKLQANS